MLFCLPVFASIFSRRRAPVMQQGCPFPSCHPSLPMQKTIQSACKPDRNPPGMCSCRQCRHNQENWFLKSVLTRVFGTSEHDYVINTSANASQRSVYLRAIQILSRLQNCSRQGSIPAKGDEAVIPASRSCCVQSVQPFLFRDSFRDAQASTEQR